MYLPFAEAGSLYDTFSTLATNALQKRDSSSNATVTVAELASQWSNPSDISTLLMIIGGDVVQGALAQSTGTWFTPVCFSFGWVSYAFIALLHVVGDGRLLPPPDYPVKLINLNSGFPRDNKNWVIGRLLRDAEAWVERKQPLDDQGIRISIFEAQERPTGEHLTRFLFDRSHVYGVVVMFVQLIIASLPVILHREWGVLLVTGAGTLLVQIAGALPQWRAEKLPNRQHSTAKYALTTGNGSKDIMIIIGRGLCLDLEELCSSDTPRNGRPWEKFKDLSDPRVDSNGDFVLHRTGSQMRKSRAALGLPYGFWMTRVVCVLLSILWLLVLINVAAIKYSTWYLLLVGAIGMFQNGILAAMERPPGTRNIPLRHIDTIRTKKVMDGLMDFETTYECGRPLLDVFFPGQLRPDEQAWWDGNQEPYDKVRVELKARSIPRRFLPPLKTTSDPKRLGNNMTLQVPQISTSSKTEKSIGNADPFLDPQPSKISDITPSSTQRSQVVSFSIEPQELAVKHEPTANPGAAQRTTSPKRSSLLSRQVMSIDEISEEISSSKPVRHSSTLSVEEVVNRARSPDWAS